MTLDIKMIRETYKSLHEKITINKERIGRPMTYVEKLLYAHMDSKEKRLNHKRGESYSYFRPNRVAMQDATAQMALLQFLQAGKSEVAVPSTVHCDHLIQAELGAKEDLIMANKSNKEVYDFLSSVSQKYGIGFWKPGAGIIHQIVLENYAFPGGMMIGTDSHTVNAGGLGMIAIGVGGADAVDVMVGMPWELKFPKLIGVKLTGHLSGWTSPKDIILKLAGILTVKGGTGAIVEYFGEGAKTLSCTGKATICNMGAEIGATTSVFAYDKTMDEYLRATHRSDVVDELNLIKNELTIDQEVIDDPEKYFDQVIHIDLDTLEPHINGPFTPDKAWPLSQFANAVKKNNYPQKLTVGLIGSCTNSSYEDLDRAASLAKQVKEKKLKIKSKFTITPGSETIRYTMQKDGLLEQFNNIGAIVLANACGPCIGQWKRTDIQGDQKNSIITSFNRNFSKRADGNPNTHSFVASPEIVTAMAIAGDLTFNPLLDTLTNDEGQKVKLMPPQGERLPPNGFAVEDNGYLPPTKQKSIPILIKKNSERLQLLSPFDAWNGQDIKDARLLIKAKDKCTTDHISMAGYWLKYRGHLDNISNNLLIGAVNFFNEKTNYIKNLLTNRHEEVPKVARDYKLKNIPSIVVGDENYGEGSSREHAAMEPRHLGVKVVLVKSFARIHETNLKKQGILALTFKSKEDYYLVQEDDLIDIKGLSNFSPDTSLNINLRHADGSIDKIIVNHTFNETQIEWFKAGSAINLIRQKNERTY